MNKPIIQEHTPDLNFVALPSASDLKAEISKLEGEISIAEGELRHLETAHKARPYRPEFVAIMGSGYRSSLLDLHSQIENVRAMLNGAQA